MLPCRQRGANRGDTQPASQKEGSSANSAGWSRVRRGGGQETGSEALAGDDKDGHTEIGGVAVLRHF